MPNWKEDEIVSESEDPMDRKLVKQKHHPIPNISNYWLYSIKLTLGFQLS